MSTNLTRVDHNHPDFKRLSKMEKWIDSMVFASLNPTTGRWKNSVREILAFHDDEGTFSLVDSFQIPSDACFEFCRYPHIACTAILMAAILEDESSFTNEDVEVFRRALEVCPKIGLHGHGYESLEGLFASVKALMTCGLTEFLRRYRGFCPEFEELMMSTKAEIHEAVVKENFIDVWGNSNEKDFRLLDLLFSRQPVFVYGTLMDAEPNHSFIPPQESEHTTGILDGYVMYDTGCFPGIVRGNGTIKGELYRVSEKTIKALDRLEGEGSLYIRKSVAVKCENGLYERAVTYVYNCDTTGMPKVGFDMQPWHSGVNYRGKDNKDLVWYVSYGSNMQQERFDTYINGGLCKFNGKHYSPCDDTSAPLRSMPIVLPYNMYYGNYDMGSWENSAVSFLDVSNNTGKSYCRAYLINRKQLHHIHYSEGRSESWYPDVIQLDDIDSIPAFTFTNKKNRKAEPASKVSFEYGSVLLQGILEAFPEMTIDQAIEYISSCGK